MLFEHEIKKKDAEIAKLKDTLKKSATIHKDKAECTTKYSRFELNNFYDGLEKDFNILDAKKSELYRNMVDEGTEMRQTIMMLINEVETLAKSVTRSPSGVPKDALVAVNWQTINKPFSLVKDEVRMAFIHILNDIKRSIGLYR